VHLKQVVMVVQQHRQGLAHNTERQPEHNVARLIPLQPLVDALCNEHERHLQDDAQESPHADQVQRHPQHQLMEHRAHKEHKQDGGPSWQAQPHGREIHVAQQPLVHRHVPQLPVLPERGCIPPVLCVCMIASIHACVRLCVYVCVRA